MSRYEIVSRHKNKKTSSYDKYNDFQEVCSWIHEFYSKMPQGQGCTLQFPASLSYSKYLSFQWPFIRDFLHFVMCYSKNSNRSDQIQRHHIRYMVYSVFHSLRLSVLSLQIGYTLLHTHRQCTKRHYLKDSFTTFLKHSLFIWFQACKDLQKYCTEHQNEDFLIKGFASQKQNPFREKSSCAVLWEHYNFNVFVLYIYL